MPEEGSSNKVAMIVLTGLVSLVVGVSGGLILNRLTSTKSQLEYQPVISEVFSGQKDSTAIFALRISNAGNKELEDVVCRIDLRDASLVEPKVAGLLPRSYTMTNGLGFVELSAPFINPDESFSIQLLIAPHANTLPSPLITLRGKGVMGKEKSASDDGAKKKIGTSVATSVSTMIIPLAVLLVLRTRPQLLFTRSHSDDQRDVLAYVLSANGFLTEASDLRRSSRQLSYWAEADGIAERCIASGDTATMRRGITTLQNLLEYAGMADTSRLLVHFNIARLAARLPDAELMRKHAALARKGSHKVIQKRIAFDVVLRDQLQVARPIES